MVIYTPLERELKERLEANACVSFVYKKANGEMRHAYGTRNLSDIPLNKRPKGIETPSEKVLNYYDLDREDWRSFRLGSLLQILDS